MDEAQIILGKHSEFAYSERVIAYLQGDVDYHKKMLWSSNAALNKEENSLKKLQEEYYEEFNHKRRKENENN